MQPSADTSLEHFPPTKRRDEHDGPEVSNSTPLLHPKVSVTPITHTTDIAPTQEDATSPSQLNCSGTVRELYAHVADVWRQQHSPPLSASSSMVAPGIPMPPRLLHGDTYQLPVPQLTPALPSLTHRLRKNAPAHRSPSPARRDKNVSAAAAGDDRAEARVPLHDEGKHSDTVNPPPSMLFSETKRRSEIPAATSLACSPPLSPSLSRHRQEWLTKESPVSKAQLAPHAPPLSPAIPAAGAGSRDSGRRMWNPFEMQDGWTASSRAGNPALVTSLAVARVHRQGATSARTHTPKATGNCAARSRSVAVAAPPFRNGDIVFQSVSRTLSAPSSEVRPCRCDVSSAKPLSPVWKNDPCGASHSPPLQASGSAYHPANSPESTPVRKKPLVLGHSATRVHAETAKPSSYCAQSSQRSGYRRGSASATTPHESTSLHRPPHLWSPDSSASRIGSTSVVNTPQRGPTSSSSNQTVDWHGDSTPSTSPPTAIGIISREETHQHQPRLPQQLVSMSPRIRTPKTVLTCSHAPYPPTTPEMTPGVIKPSFERREKEEILSTSRCCTPSHVHGELQQPSLAPAMHCSRDHSAVSIGERSSFGHRISLCGSAANSFTPTLRSSSSSSNTSRQSSYTPVAPVSAPTNVELLMPRRLSAVPPPPPWSPREALHWMRSRLTPQEQEEIMTHDLVYYCGPPAQPRTACGVQDNAAPSPAAQCAEAEAASMSSPPTNREEIASPTTYSFSSSYFPVTIGMHICFRYEVMEVLGFGTFSVVVNAVDHAASPLSPERHCALKLIRRELLYQNAAKAEWAVFEQLKESCEAVSSSSAKSFEESVCTVYTDHHLKPSSHPNSYSAWSQLTLPRLSMADQRALYTASVLIPRSHFEYRGYHVIVFPLLGFSVRDVIELRCDTTEVNTHNAARTSSPAPTTDVPPAQAKSRAAAMLPSEVVTSVLAQLVRALHFMHHCAHIAHGDIKLENIAFVDRSTVRNHSIPSSHPVEFGGAASSQPPHHVSLSTIGNVGAFATPPSTHEFLRPCSGVPSLLPVNKTLRQPPQTRSTTASRRPNAAESIGKRTITEAGGRRSACNSTPTSSPSLQGFMVLRPPPRDTESADDPDKDVMLGPSNPNPNAPGSESTCSPQQRLSDGDLLDPCSSSGAMMSLPGRSPCMTGSRTGALTSSPLSTPADAGLLEKLGAGEAANTALGEEPRHGGSGSSPVGGAPLAGRLGHDSDSDACCGGSGGGGEASSVIASSTRLRLTYSLPQAMTSPNTSTTSSRCALIDFGHAHPIPPGTTGTAFPLQSPSYRCPEMALRLPYTTAIDMWSVGCVLYELRAGHALFPNACDDTTMLQSAVRVLGMPDAAFLATVKTCWRRYKQQKASMMDAVAHAHINPTSPCTNSKQPRPPEAQPSQGAEDTEQSDDTLMIERCWRNFIQVLNEAAGDQREHERRLEHECQSSTLSVMDNPPQNPSGGGGTTTWETQEQLALLRVMFPSGRIDEHGRCFSLTDEGDQRQFAWVDFLLGCLYWDADERLTATEARVHPFLSANFTSDLRAANTVATSANAASSATDQRSAAEDAAMGASGPFALASRGVSGEENAIIRPTHCSGLYYLSRHPLTSRLLKPAPKAVLQSSSPQDHGSTVDDNATSLLAPLRMLPSAIVPFKLPSTLCTAPSARLWEEREQLLQQDRKTVPLHHLSRYDSGVDLNSTFQTPADPLSPSPCH